LRSFDFYPSILLLERSYQETVSPVRPKWYGTTRKLF